MPSASDSARGLWSCVHISKVSSLVLISLSLSLSPAEEGKRLGTVVGLFSPASVGVCFFAKRIVTQLYLESNHVRSIINCPFPSPSLNNQCYTAENFFLFKKPWLCAHLYRLRKKKGEKRREEGRGSCIYKSRSWWIWLIEQRGQVNRLVGVHKSAIGGILEIRAPKSSKDAHSGDNQQVKNLFFSVLVKFLGFYLVQRSICAQDSTLLNRFTTCVFFFLKKEKERENRLGHWKVYELHAYWTYIAISIASCARLFKVHESRTQKFSHGALLMAW